jgi:hypothetical protein
LVNKAGSVVSLAFPVGLSFELQETPIINTAIDTNPRFISFDRKPLRNISKKSGVIFRMRNVGITPPDDKNSAQIMA